MNAPGRSDTPYLARSGIVILSSFSPFLNETSYIYGTSEFHTCMHDAFIVCVGNDSGSQPYPIIRLRTVYIDKTWIHMFLVLSLVFRFSGTGHEALQNRQRIVFLFFIKMNRNNTKISTITQYFVHFYKYFSGTF